MGVETPEPVINQRCYELNFTNEGGVGGTTRLLKNIAGLWLVQECRRVWKEAGLEYGFEDLMDKAAKSPHARRAHQPRSSELRRAQGHARRRFATTAPTPARTRPKTKARSSARHSKASPFAIAWSSASWKS